jgi:hypothetical protein
MEAPKKLFFKKLLTIFAAVIWSSSRWHHCQAEMISSESLKSVSHNAEIRNVTTGSQ